MISVISLHTKEEPILVRKEKQEEKKKEGSLFYASRVTKFLRSRAASSCAINLIDSCIIVLGTSLSFIYEIPEATAFFVVFVKFRISRTIYKRKT